MRRAKITAMLLVTLMTVSIMAALPPVAATPAPTGGPAPMDDSPEINFTWLRADGVGTIG